MTSRPNRVYLAAVAVAGLGVITLAVLAAEHHGKRRGMWLMKAEGAS